LELRKTFPQKQMYVSQGSLLLWRGEDERIGMRKAWRKRSQRKILEKEISKRRPTVFILTAEDSAYPELGKRTLRRRKKVPRGHGEPFNKG